MRLLTPCAVLLLGALGLVAAPRPGGTSPLPAEAAEVARAFLLAFSRNDRPAVRAMLPKKDEDLYGPCPFSRMPSLSRPRADGRVGAIEFFGRAVDPGLPDQGIIILRGEEEGGRKRWRVRQIYWYDELPKGADIPQESPTSADKRQEPALREAALEFLRGWLRRDYAKMSQFTFKWWEIPRRPPTWVKMTRVEVTGRPTTLDGIRVSYQATLKVAKLLPKQVTGDLWLVNENGRWRVRPLTLSMEF